MAKQFWEKYRIGDDGILVEIETQQRFGFFVLDDGKTISVIPEEDYIKSLTIMEHLFDDFMPPSTKTA